MERLSRFVRRRRRLVLALWGALLLASLPFAARQTENLTGGGFDVPGTGSVAVEEQIDRFEGATPETLAVVLEGAGPQAAVGRVEDAVATVDRVDLGGEPTTDGSVMLLPLTFDGNRDEALDAAKELREELEVGERVDGVQAYLVGQSALWAGMQELQQEDLEKAEAAGFPAILIVLLVVLPSVLLPLKAVLMNLLSIGAAYGVIVAVFQWGWLDGVTGYESLGYINTVTPPLLLAIVFGLSMDYEVFLLSRIRERYLATGDNRLAVAQGLQASAKVITSAALIMVVVFGTFALTGVPQIKEIGVGLAVAIALDATLVRLVLVPATMELMGKWNWWLPPALDRILPRADFESGAEQVYASGR